MREQWLSDWTRMITKDKQGKEIFKHFLNIYITKKEGMVCSVDKTRFIHKQIKKSILLDEDVSLYDDYTNCKEIEVEKWKNQAYWSPTSFKNVADVMKAFRDWYNLEKMGESYNILNSILKEIEKQGGEINLDSIKYKYIVKLEKTEKTKEEMLSYINFRTELFKIKEKFSILNNKFNIKIREIEYNLDSLEECEALFQKIKKRKEN